MLAALARIIFGLLLACLVAGIVQTLFVVTPFDIVSISGDAFTSSLANVGLLALFAATHTAMFVAPFGFIAAVLGEWQHVRQLMYYALIGIVIALAGLYALHLGEQGGMTILNPYAALAYFTTGLLAGFTYWLASGRFAGGYVVDDSIASEQNA